jgi:hypothetical protein
MNWSVFMVRAATSNDFLFYDSAPDSGYSLDNVAPNPPSALAVSHGPDGTALRWTASDAHDLLGYRVFRDADGVTPQKLRAVAFTRTTQWTDVTGNASFRYRVASVDSAGNESPPVDPDRETGDHMVPLRLALEQNQPNPFNPSTTIRYDVPAPGGRVTLAVYDVHGRLVRALVEEQEAAGSRSVTWDGRSNAGTRVASGTYFCRLESNGVVLTRKMTLLE